MNAFRQRQANSTNLKNDSNIVTKHFKHISVKNLDYSNFADPIKEIVKNAENVLIVKDLPIEQMFCTYCMYNLRGANIENKEVQLTVKDELQTFPLERAIVLYFLKYFDNETLRTSLINCLKEKLKKKIEFVPKDIPKKLIYKHETTKFKYFCVNMLKEQKYKFFLYIPSDINILNMSFPVYVDFTLNGDVLNIEKVSFNLSSYLNKASEILSVCKLIGHFLNFVHTNFKCTEITCTDNLFFKVQEDYGKIIDYPISMELLVAEKRTLLSAFGFLPQDVTKEELNSMIEEGYNVMSQFSIKRLASFKYSKLKIWKHVQSSKWTLLKK
jgi:hypothetical protein